MRIYLDANATYGGLRDVLEQVPHLSGAVHNPSAIHSAGQKARALIEQSRHSLRELINAPQGDYELFFTSGATESNNLALYLPFWQALNGRKKIQDLEYVISTVEHPSVLEPAARLKALGAKVTLCAPTVEAMMSAVSPTTNFISLMYANNETGILYPVDLLLSEVRGLAPQALIHTDAVQVVGRLPVSLRDLGVDLLTISGHKIGAFPGVGALVVRDGIDNQATILGGAQEKRWRAGTENVPGIASFGLASRHHLEHLADNVTRMAERRDQLEAELCELGGVSSPFCHEQRLPNTTMLRFEGVDASDLVVALDLEGVCASTGSACSSGKPLPSTVLTACGLSEQEAAECVRFSFRADAEKQEVTEAISRIRLCLERMKEVEQ